MSPAGFTAGAAPVIAPGLDGESAQWIGALRACGAEREVALGDLHARLLRIARAELRRQPLRAHRRRRAR